MTPADFVERLGQANQAARVFASIPSMGTFVRLPLLRVGHHGVPAGQPHESFPIELFTPRWGAAVSGVPITVDKIIAEVKAMPQDRDVRVAVPTDAGHHRILSINAIAFGLMGTIELEVEPWEHNYPIIRTDDPGDGGEAEPVVEEPVQEEMPASQQSA